MGAQRKTYEAPDMGAFMGRTLRAMVRRAADGDQEVLSVLAALEQQLHDAQRDAAQQLHARGQSWTFIGRELGITRQAAQQRFGAYRSARDVAQVGIDAAPLRVPPRLFCGDCAPAGARQLDDFRGRCQVCGVLEGNLRELV